MRSSILLLGAILVLGCSSPAHSPPSGKERGPTLTYLGVAGWQLQTGEHVLLVDPYFTRVNAKSDDAIIASDEAAVAKFAPAHVDVILVGHSHYDHAIDAATIARRTNATVVGTDSTKRLVVAGGAPPEHAIIVRGADVLELAPFSIHVFAGLHSLTGQVNEPIADPIVLPMPMSGYKEGGTLQYLVTVNGTKVLFIGTANFVEGELNGIRPDVAVIATGLRSKVPDYACRLMKALGAPPLVFTNHFDDFRAPLHAGPIDLDEESRNDLAAFSSEIHACAPNTRVVVPNHFERFEL